MYIIHFIFSPFVILHFVILQNFEIWRKEDWKNWRRALWAYRLQLHSEDWRWSKIKAVSFFKDKFWKTNKRTWICRVFWSLERLNFPFILLKDFYFEFFIISIVFWSLCVGCNINKRSVPCGFKVFQRVSFGFWRFSPIFLNYFDYSWMLFDSKS